MKCKSYLTLLPAANGKQQRNYHVQGSETKSINSFGNPAKESIVLQLYIMVF